MNDLVIPSILGLPALVQRAATQLASASSAAEILDARDMASVVYDLAKKAARFAKAKQAHDEILVKAAYAQADALEIECMAKRRLADEYDAAQERGEIRTQADNQAFSKAEKASGPEIISPKDIHEARLIRDAEDDDPGVIRRTLDARLATGDEPTRAGLIRDLRPLPDAQPRPRVSDPALWLWGRLRDFERLGYFEADPASLLSEMTEPMRADVRDVIGHVLEFLSRLNRETSR